MKARNNFKVLLSYLSSRVHLGANYLKQEASITIKATFLNPWMFFMKRSSKIEQDFGHFSNVR